MLSVGVFSSLFFFCLKSLESEVFSLDYVIAIYIFGTIFSVPTAHFILLRDS